MSEWKPRHLALRIAKVWEVRIQVHKLTMGTICSINLRDSNQDNKSYVRRRTYQDDIEDDYNPQPKLRKAQSNVDDYRPQSRQSDEYVMNKRPEPEYLPQGQQKPASRNQYIEQNNDRDRPYQPEKEYNRASQGNNADRNRKPQPQKTDPSKMKLKNENVVTAILSLVKDLGE